MQGLGVGLRGLFEAILAQLSQVLGRSLMGPPQPQSWSSLVSPTQLGTKQHPLSPSYRQGLDGLPLLRGLDLVRQQPGG